MINEKNPPVSPVALSTHHHHGISLRDHFAALAMQGLLAGDTNCQIPCATIAEMAYEQADYMLEERNKE